MNLTLGAANVFVAANLAVSRRPQVVWYRKHQVEAQEQQPWQVDTLTDAALFSHILCEELEGVGSLTQSPSVLLCTGAPRGRASGPGRAQARPQTSRPKRGSSEPDCIYPW